MLSALDLFGIVFFLVAYIVFAFWFFAKVTEGFVFSPRTRQVWGFREICREMNPAFLYGVLILNIVISVSSLFLVLWEKFNKHA
jgi:hypothetical protein